MKVRSTVEGGRTTLAVSGRIDTTTAPELQRAVDALPAGVKELIFGFADVEYISSAGLRVMLHANKLMLAGGGTMSVEGAVPAVREVFAITGFDSVIDLK